MTPLSRLFSSYDHEKSLPATIPLGERDHSIEAPPAKVKLPSRSDRHTSWAIITTVSMRLSHVGAANYGDPTARGALVADGRVSILADQEGEITARPREPVLRP